MKMIRSTNRTSMSGVTLIYGTARFPPPPLIPISQYLFVANERVTQKSQDNSLPNSFLLSESTSGGLKAFLPVRDKSYLRYAARFRVAYDINNANHLPVADVDAALDVNDAVFLCLLVNHLLQIIHQALSLRIVLLLQINVVPDIAQIEFAIVRNRDDKRVLRVDLFVVFRVGRFPWDVHVDSLLQIGRDEHEDNQEHQHDVHHRRDVDLRVEAATASRCHSHD